jgi:putative flippase GtrA
VNGPAGPRTQLKRFVSIGILVTLANLTFYALLRGDLGPLTANLVAMLICTVANTAANRRLTFNIRGPKDRAKHQLQGLAVFGLGLGLTTAALTALSSTTPHAPRTYELAVLVAANLGGTILRFVLFRAWVFRPTSAACRGDTTAA